MDAVWIGLVVMWAQVHSPVLLGVLSLFACGAHLAAHDWRRLLVTALVFIGGTLLHLELQQPIATTALAYGLVLAHFARGRSRRTCMVAAVTALASQAWHTGMSAEAAVAQIALAGACLGFSLVAGKLAFPGQAAAPLGRKPH